MSSSGIDATTRELSTDGRAQRLTSENASRIAVVDKKHLIDARLLWIGEKTAIYSAWLSTDAEGMHIADTTKIDGKSEIVDLGQFNVDDTTAILAVDNTSAYRVVFSYSTSYEAFGDWYYGLGVPDSIDLEFEAPKNYDGNIFLLPSRSGMYLCKADDGVEFKDFTVIPETRGKTSHQFKKMMCGFYDVVYLDGGKVYEIYNSSYSPRHICCDAWQLSAATAFVDLSGITDIDRILVGRADRGTEDNPIVEQAIVNLGACKNAIFKKRRNGYYENNRKNHILSVQVSYTPTGELDSRSSDVLY